MEAIRQPKEHGLLFIAAMARAAVAGIKTQTRRLPTASNGLVDGVGISAKRWTAMQFDWSRAVIDAGPSPAGNAGPYIKVPAGNGETWHRIYPRYEVGDRIWGRETFALERQVEHGQLPPYGYERAWMSDPEGMWLQPHYKATDPTPDLSYEDTDGEPMCRWKPSIHMPRWAARIVRDITAVRVERLQDISEADAMAEGVHYSLLEKIQAGQDRWARHAYKKLWESINGSGSWDANPPVIVIEFAGVQNGEAA
jgi:hypothetical protein